MADTERQKTSPAVLALAILFALFIGGLFLRTCFGEMV